nr:MAG TPA: hypothetical protein [Caudoviricetes sp.]
MLILNVHLMALFNLLKLDLKHLRLRLCKKWQQILKLLNRKLRIKLLSMTQKLKKLKMLLPR